MTSIRLVFKNDDETRIGWYLEQRQGLVVPLEAAASIVDLEWCEDTGWWLVQVDRGMLQVNKLAAVTLTGKQLYSLLFAAYRMGVADTEWS